MPFAHGTSLFDTEVRVPLLIIPPSKMQTAAAVTVREPVSLRDIAATIADMAGLTTDSSFPGESLTRFWRKSVPRVSRRFSLQVYPNSSRTTPRAETIGAFHPPLPPRASLKDSEWSYVRREVEVGE